MAAEKTPVTVPRCVTNQRFAMIVPNVSAIEPVPRPMKTPHSSHSCHGSPTRVTAALANPTMTSDHVTVRRTPHACIRAAVNGAAMP